ncbi:hypothetical protein KP509_22G037900 [Ceratopteris richardii]|uniref:Uncharacterized protein n=1 Tax=Ceratopteris richardii TaxID=49495 RepID=A0A8T2S653_CERRI|nr:hypothetical protein KP509_22G037900 [Ceratopteris richardii]
MAGKIGSRFQLTRSVWQRCPLTPFLFLFFAEAIACFLYAPQTDLRGLKLPFSNSKLIEAEFVDDTTLYLQGEVENLRKAEQAVNMFCNGSGAGKQLGANISPKVIF